MGWKSWDMSETALTFNRAQKVNPFSLLKKYRFQTFPPFQGHLAVAEYERKHARRKSVTVVTQNVDGLHARAGSRNIIELHGNMFKTRCTKCNEVLVNTDSPICAVGRGFKQCCMDVKAQFTNCAFYIYKVKK